MRPSLLARQSVRANRSRPIALLLGLLLFTAALPKGSISHTVQATNRTGEDSSTAPAQLSTEVPATMDSPQEATSNPSAEQARLAEAYGKLPLSFEANQGQFDQQVQFLARGSGYGLYLTASEAVLVVTKSAPRKEEPRVKSASALESKFRSAQRGSLEADGRAKAVKQSAPQYTTVHMKLEGANAKAEAQAMEELPGQTNYFIGNNPQKWRTGIPSYAKVMYREVYPGVDLVYYGRQQQLEYDFVVAPGVDPARIKLNFEGAQSIDVDAQGDLILHTEGGDIRQHKPVVYQEVDGARQEVPSRYEMKDQRRVGFKIESYDANKPLVIDPVLTYSTFLGGSSGDAGNSIAVDAAGSAYVTGWTSSSDFPLSHPMDSDAGLVDVFVSKLNPDGSALLYSTYLGGSDTDFGYSVAVDNVGQAYLTGYTYSADFPLMNPLQPSLHGKDDAFVTKLNSQGSAFIYSTYLGASSYDVGFEVKTDADGNAYVAGATFSHDLATVNPFQAAKQGDQAFKSTNGGGDWSASDTGLNAARMGDLAIDPAHPATLYAASERGIFKSTDGGSTWVESNNGIDSFADVTKVVVNPVQTSNLWIGTTRRLYRSSDAGSTWTGSFQGNVYALALDPVNPSTIFASLYGQVWKSTDGGQTWTSQISSFPDIPGDVTAFAIDPTHTSTVYAGTDGLGVYKSTDGGINWDSISVGLPVNFIRINALTINPANPSILYVGMGEHGVYRSTNGGGQWSAVNNGLTINNDVYALTIDPAHPSVIYAGTNGSGIFKSTNGGNSWSANATGLTNRVVKDVEIDPTASSKVYAVTDSLSDVFVTKLDPAGSAQLYATYLGGNEDDQGFSIAVDGDGNAYLTGQTRSTNFPLASPLQPTFASPNSFSNDAFVTKLDPSGAHLSYSTYLGGNGEEEGADMVVDAAGNAYVAGIAIQLDPALPMTFPVTPGAFRTTFNDGSYSDAFVTKINAAGSNLAYSTYLGGNDGDFAYSIAVGSNGQAVVTGETYSTNFPIVGPTQGRLNFNDAFVTRFNATGSAVIFSTYHGGDSNDGGYAIALDPANNIYVTGRTRSYNFPTVNPLQASQVGTSDAFVTKFGAALAFVQISGRVTLNNVGLSGVTVTLTGSGGFTPRTVLTGSNGSYLFNNIPGRRNYTVTPSKEGYTFYPTSRTYTNLGTNITNQNFLAFESTRTIYARAEDYYNRSLAGVKFTLTGTRTKTCITDSSGECAFTGLPTGGDYTVTPMKGGATFTPAFRRFNDLSQDEYAVFAVKFSIKGRVTGINNTGIAGVAVKLDGYRPLTTTTDSNGNYSFNNLPAGISYTITPMKTGLSFNPVSKVINGLTSTQIVNFQALVSITGKVRLAGTTQGIGGVTMRLTGSRTAATTTGADGIYTFANLPAGGDYTVTPSKTGYTFTPPSRTFTDLTASQGLRTAYFDGTH